MSDSDAPSPNIWRTGSPGTRCMRRKTAETTNHKTGSVYSKRLVMKRSIAWLFGHFGFDSLDLHLRDAVRGHGQNGKAIAIELDALASGRNLADAGEEKSGQRLEAFIPRQNK